MSKQPQVWLMLAFPRDTAVAALHGFARSKSGRSWYRIMSTRNAALSCKRVLIEAGIPFKCSKVAASTPRREAQKRYAGESQYGEIERRPRSTGRAPQPVARYDARYAHNIINAPGGLS